MVSVVESVELTVDLVVLALAALVLVITFVSSVYHKDPVYHIVNT